MENPGIGPFLLGVVWKHFGDLEDVLDEGFLPIGAVVKGNSGLASVIPAAKVKEILDGIPPVCILPLSDGAGATPVSSDPTGTGSDATHKLIV